MTPPRVAALLWDLDGTLVDSEPLHARATDDALAELGLPTPEGFHARSLGLSAERVYDLLVAETGTSVGPAAWDALKWRHYSALATRLAARQPAAGLVAALAVEGLAQAVVSNSAREEVDLALEATGLAGHFALSLARDDVARPKPDPEGYRRASERFGLVPEACLVIEDSVTGAQAGLSAGMRTIFHPQHAADAPAGAIALPAEGDLTALIRSFLDPARSLA